MLSVTLFDLRSTSENPIKPKTIVTEVSNLVSIVNDYLDEFHHLVITQISTSFKDDKDEAN